MSSPPSDDLDDHALVALLRGRDEQADAAFRLLYERYRDETYTFLVRLVGDEALAEDVLQTAFLNVYRGLERFHPERSFRAWLYQIVRNSGLDALRARRKDERLAEEKAKRAASATDSTVVPAVSRLEDSERARAALEALPPELRALLVQRHGLGMKLEELADSWSCTSRTVLNRLNTAMTLLAQNLIGGRS
jgi:RNA polymerase sigma-70 factor (ECF subfamily)